jgi:hypothetical protein
MIPEEIEEKLMQACQIISMLLNNPSEGIIQVAKNFIEENGQDE